MATRGVEIGTGDAPDDVAALGESHLQDGCVAVIGHQEHRREGLADGFGGGSTSVHRWFSSGLIDRLELVDRPV